MIKKIILIIIGALASIYAFACGSPIIVASSLPNHFGFGPFVPGAAFNAWSQFWIAGSGVPFDYQYAYFSQTTQANINSQVSAFVTNAVNAHTIPVITMYIFGSAQSSCGGGGPVQTDINIPSVMNCWYGYYKLYLQSINATAPNQVTIIHIEPDMFSYIEQGENAGATLPVNIPTAVSSSNFFDASGFANNLAGMSQFLVHEASVVAPKVIVAIDHSVWGENYSLADSTQNYAPPATTYANWFKGLGSPAPGLVFFNIADRDCGCGQAGYPTCGNSNNAAPIANYCSPLINTNLLGYVTTFYNQTSEKSMVWQVPGGNSYMPNTVDHFQSIEVEYLLNGVTSSNFSVIQSWVNAGDVAWLVGSGQFQDTSVTNYTIEPGETLCTNPHVDSVPSNVQTNCDGGLFEYFTRLYYTSPVLINTTPTIPTISTIANVSVSVGATATFNATVAGNPTPSCQWMKNGAIITTNGTTCSSYTTPATVSGDNGALFSLKATNSAGTATSNNATLTVTTCPVLTTTSGGSFTDGSGNVWTLAANGDATINGTVASNGQGTSSLTLRAGVTWGQDAATGNWFSWNGSAFVGPFALPACS